MSTGTCFEKEARDNSEISYLLRNMRYFYGNFLLAETEVVMTTLISSHVKDKIVSCEDKEIFVTGKILVFHQYLYIKMDYVACLANMRA